MYLLCARHLHLEPSLFIKHTNDRELNKDIFCRHVSIWSNGGAFCATQSSFNPKKQAEQRWKMCRRGMWRKAVRWDRYREKQKRVSTARADHCITQACCFLNLTTDIKLVGVRCCHVERKEVDEKIRDLEKDAATNADNQTRF